jgi:flagellar basal-body rod protein FlgC
MGAFDGIDVARTGAGFAKHWLDTIAHNLANVNTVSAPGQEPFRARMVVAQERIGTDLGPSGSGVQVGAVLEDPSTPTLVHDPDHPLADAAGYVTAAVVDLPAQFADMIVAQRSYSANLRALTSAQEAYQSALRLGAR